MTTTAQHSHREPGTRRARWAALGAVVTIVVVGGGGLFVARAAPDGGSGLTTITPRRIVDTREGLGIPAALTAGQPAEVVVTGRIETPGGSIGMYENTPHAVVVPANATGVVLNVTVVHPSQAGFVSVTPVAPTSDPETSNVNFGAGETVANMVIVELGAGYGRRSDDRGLAFTLYNARSAHLVVDVFGYVGASGATPSPVTAPPDLPIPSGSTARGEIRLVAPPMGELTETLYLAGRAPAPLTEDDIELVVPFRETSPTCTGTAEEPTAPPGRLCIYATVSLDLDESTVSPGPDPTRSFVVYLRSLFDPTPGARQFSGILHATYAYTAP